jgi:heptosyltransferase-1
VRVLIVKLSSLGDVVHAMPVVHDIINAHPGAVIDWVVEPGFAPVVRHVRGVNEVIECALRRWTKSWWTSATRSQWGAFRRQLRQHRYDAVIDLQGLTKSALIARLAHGVSYGLANRTDGAGFEPTARWLVDHAIRVEPHIHVVDRSRVVAAQALGYRVEGPPQYGLRATSSIDSASVVIDKAAPPMVVFVHGTSRVDKLWPEASWIELGRSVIAQGWRIAMTRAGPLELERAQRIAAALSESKNDDVVQIWPQMNLDQLVDRFEATQGVIGVDSGPSHIAVALNLPHVQIYNWPTAWRTGPQPSHGHAYQVSVEAQPTPTVDAVWNAWTRVLDVSSLGHRMAQSPS